MKTLIALVMFACPALAGWTTPVTVDTGWVAANPQGQCPEQWTWVDAPAQPLGATLVRLTRDSVEYAYSYEVTNISPEYVSWRGDGTYQMLLGHLPLWHAPEGLRIPGSDDEHLPYMAHVYGVSAGGGGYYEYLPPGATRTGWDVTGWYTDVVSVDPVAPVGSWWSRSRDGVHHALAFTPVTWHENHYWSWADGTPPAGWMPGHNPCSSTMQVMCRVVAVVEFYMPES